MIGWKEKTADDQLEEFLFYICCVHRFRKLIVELRVGIGAVTLAVSALRLSMTYQEHPNKAIQQAVVL